MTSDDLTDLTRLPVSGRLAWWGTAWLRGQVGPDDLLDAVLADDVTHVVLTPEGPHDAGGVHPPVRPAGSAGSVGAEGLVSLLGRLRSAGATGLGAAFPAEGDLVGLGGPVAFNDAALEVGEAVVAVSTELGLVPSRVGPTIEWRVLPARRRQLPDVGEADRELRRVLLESAQQLAALDVARWRPEIADQMMNLRHRPALVAAPGVPARCVDLAARGLQALEIAELALADDGAAINVHEIGRRRGALAPLARAGRRALVAACSPEAWPPD